MYKKNSNKIQTYVEMVLTLLINPMTEASYKLLSSATARFERLQDEVGRKPLALKNQVY